MVFELHPFTILFWNINKNLCDVNNVPFWAETQSVRWLINIRLYVLNDTMVVNSFLMIKSCIFNNKNKINGKLILKTLNLWFVLSIS